MPNENEQIFIDQQLPLADPGGIYGHDPHPKTQNGLFALLPSQKKCRMVEFLLLWVVFYS